MSCRDCEGKAATGTNVCERHLCGWCLVLLDRKQWPRLNVGGGSIVGDDQWRPWLREAKASDLTSVLELLRAEVQT